MNALNRLTSLLVVLIIIIGCFSSCDGMGKGKQTDTYVANVRIKFATNDGKMSAAVDAMNSSSVISVDNDDIQIETTSSMNDISTKETYVYVDNVMYHSTSVTVGNKSASEYEMASVSQTEVDSLVSKAGVGADIGIGDFLTQEMTGEKGKYTYTCSDMTDEAKESLCKIIGGSFEKIDATVRIDSADYILETDNGRYMSYILSCNLLITMNGQTYEVTMRTYCDYDYDVKVGISTPLDIEKYEQVSSEDIID